MGIIMRVIMFLWGVTCMMCTKGFTQYIGHINCSKFTKLLTDLVGGAHGEDMTSDWHSSWARQSEVPHPLLGPWSIYSTHHYHSGIHFQGCSLERAMCCWDYLDNTRDGTMLKPLHETFKVPTRVGAEICSSCCCRRQASCVYPLVY